MQKTDNRSMGNRFEQELAQTLSARGFWVHVLQQNKRGQPADIIAVKGKYHTLIDCKVVSEGKSFPFSRIEENQRLAMRMFEERGRHNCYFAIRFPDGSVRFLSRVNAVILEAQGKKSLSGADAVAYTLDIDQWIRQAGRWDDA